MQQKKPPKNPAEWFVNHMIIKNNKKSFKHNPKGSGHSKHFPQTDRDRIRLDFIVPLQ